ncbi:spore germination protein [Paenibacillus sp. MBLB4367]|uniref:spore germination protein n=1 Tax=Paenibacillus sp. MBLB4367 TaxID=3384767 RepID=UPI003907F7E8
MTEDSPQKRKFDESEYKRKKDQEKLTDEEKRLMKAERIPLRMSDVKRTLEEMVGLGRSFDVILREMVFGAKRTGIFYLNGLVKDTVLDEVLKRLSIVREEEVDFLTLTTFMERFIPHIQVEKVDTMSDTVNKVLAGGTAIFIENETSAIMIDAKSFPVRSSEEPSLERVVRGSRDGFVETLLTNVTLVRRRLRDPRLKLEMLQVGERTKTDVCLAYINDIADQKLVESIRDKIRELETDGLPLAEKQLEEALLNKRWNPYPVVRYSERPDVVSSHLLEGHVALFVDTSPSVIILPSTFFHLVQHAEEYRQTPFIGTYLRWVRYFGILSSLFLLPLWFLMVAHPEFKPPGMGWLGPQDNGHLSLLVQFVIAEVGIDLMRMAAVHTPTPLATAMGLIAAILIGEIAIKTGLFVPEVILYLSVATIGIFATPSYELGLANRVSRLILLLATAAFAVPGFVVGTTLWVMLLAFQRSFNSPFLWPFIPFNAKAFYNILVRVPFSQEKSRLSLTKPNDSSRQPT